MVPAMLTVSMAEDTAPLLPCQQDSPSCLESVQPEMTLAGRRQRVAPQTLTAPAAPSLCFPGAPSCGLQAPHCHWCCSACSPFTLKAQQVWSTRAYAVHQVTCLHTTMCQTRVTHVDGRCPICTQEVMPVSSFPPMSHAAHGLPARPAGIAAAQQSGLGATGRAVAKQQPSTAHAALLHIVLHEQRLAEVSSTLDFSNWELCYVMAGLKLQWPQACLQGQPTPLHGVNHQAQAAHC